MKHVFGPVPSRRLGLSLVGRPRAVQDGRKETPGVRSRAESSGRAGNRRQFQLHVLNSDEIHLNLPTRPPAEPWGVSSGCTKG